MSTADLTSRRQITPPDDPDYPSRDGKPLSDNTKQFEWIMTLQGGIDAHLADRPDVVVTGDCLWYPVEGDAKIRIAPDTMVVFGRPRGYRGSYIQHREGGVAPQVAFEVLSPGNRPAEMRRKLAFYEEYGIEEYYVLDPDFGRHQGYLRSPAGVLEPIAELFGWVSPRLGLCFELATGKEPPLRILRPDGRPLEAYAAISRRADQAQERAERLAAQLRALGLEPED